ncbi:aminoglycoside phosphotransferase [Caballeronia arvi]|uniref:Hydroxylysine kinase n=1 Tax=Caballeronia arvi TaxID=1777135 RepID=A0A158JSL1_9BURK|nr:phosphotransferase [Caballeronia arvi]SAL71806.1 aminoglycoside phosphotransferase [Caballeronia arvi]
MSVLDVSSEGGLAAAYISMEPNEASSLAAEVYGIRGTATKFATEKDDTFRINVDDGRKFILKVANPSEDESEIDFQVAMMVHIEDRDPEVPVPRVIADGQGRLHRYIEDQAGQRRIARLMTYAEGTPLDSTGSNAQEREKVGEILARMRYALEDFTHPGESRVLAWDVQHLLNLAPLLEGVENPEQRRQLEQGMGRYEALAPQIAKLRRQVLHNDFSKSNIVVDHELSEFVTGIIDFGDSVRTAVAIDVSTALLNQLPRDARENPVDDVFAHGRDVLRGYLSIAELTEQELLLIPHLTMSRVVARALITLWRVKQFPENAAYIMRNTEQGWGQLDWFLSRTVDEVSATLLP